MPHSLIWLPDVLKQVGLKVATVEGWEDRGTGPMGDVFGVICHHTGTQADGIMPTLNTLVRGRSDLRGPLSQLGLGRDGTFFVIAAGRANHAGTGVWRGIANGNGNFIGIEAENRGTASDPWPLVQLDAYHRGVAAILKHIGQDAEFCAAHREYALPAGRKPDPLLDMNAFRDAVAAILDGTAAPPELIPLEEPTGPSAARGRPTLRRGATGEHVRTLQRKLKIDPPGPFGPKTEAAVRAFQREHALVPDGIVGPKTWAVVDTLP
jgi:hypothetical protein